KLVEYYLETLRPSAHQDQEVLAEVRSILDRILLQFEKFIAGKKTILGTQLSQCDLDIGSALGYTSLRYSKDWETRFPNAKKYYDGLLQRDSFKKTQPPA